MNLIQYRTHAGRADENQGFIEAVFDELRAHAPPELRYLVLRLADASFLHLVEGAGRELTGLAAFQRFQKDVRERCVELPRASAAVLVGNYRMLRP